MEQTSNAKIISMLLTPVFIAQALVGFLPASVMMCVDAPLLARLAYPFFHTGIVHALLNAWCFLSIAFILPTSLWKLAAAYIIAISVPDLCLPASPVVGLSGFCYALLGLFTCEVRSKWLWAGQIWFSILLGIILPNVAVGVHAYCFAAGTLLSALNHPFIKVK